MIILAFRFFVPLFGALIVMLFFGLPRCLHCFKLRSSCLGGLSFVHPDEYANANDHGDKRARGRSKSHWEKCAREAPGGKIREWDAGAEDGDRVVDKWNHGQSIGAEIPAEAEMNARKNAVPNVAPYILPAQPDHLRAARLGLVYKQADKRFCGKLYHKDSGDPPYNGQNGGIP